MHITNNKPCIKQQGQTNLLSFDVAIAHPLSQTWPPVLHHVGFGELLALAVAEATLRLYGGDDVDAVEVYLQPLLGLRRHLVLGAPSAAVRLRPQPATEKEALGLCQITTDQ